MTIIYLAPIPFDGLKQRPQYIAEGLAGEHRVIYVEPTISLMRYILRGGEKPAPREKSLSPTLRVLRLSGYATAHRSLETISPLLCVSERLQLRKLIREADLAWVGYSPWFNCVRGFSGRLVYDKMDDDLHLTRNSLLKKLIAKVEPRLIERADTVFVTAQRFYDEIKPKKERTFLVRNAVDAKQAAPVPPAMEKEPGTRVFGYVGMIGHWFDMEAVQTILDADERNRVVLVGPVEIPRTEHPRLRYVGEVPKNEVGGWIESFDVCMYPFKRSELLDTIDPVKIYEYLAQNKPVLAADSAETRGFGEKLCRYANGAELCEKLNGGIKAPFQTDEESAAFVAENTWERRMEIILKEIGWISAAAGGKV